MRSGISRLDAASGTNAKLTNGVDSSALSASTIRSQCSSIVVPMPTARPCTAATSGRARSCERLQETADVPLALKTAGGNRRELADIISGREHVALAPDQHDADGGGGFRSFDRGG